MPAMPGTPHGHLWTIMPDLLGRVRPRALVDRPWSLVVPTPEGGPGPSGPVQLTGEYGGPPDAPDELLPVTLGAIRGDERYPVHVVAADSTHPVTRYFEEHKESTSLHRPLISFSRYFEMRPRIEESPRFRVLFRYSDLEGTPAFFDNAYGKVRRFHECWTATSHLAEWCETEEQALARAQAHAGAPQPAFA